MLWLSNSAPIIPSTFRNRTMNFYRASVAVLHICFLLGGSAAAGGNPPRFFAGDISINCGSSGTSPAVNGRSWIGDVIPEVLSSVKLKGLSKSSTVVQKNLISADNTVVYETARISRSRFSYEFRLNRGQKILRLHFYPALYKGFKGLEDLFTVEAGGFTLLSNFSASLTAQAQSVTSFSKEFCLSIKENRSLTVTFTPASVGSLLDTYAFVNGIEILSVPSRVSYFSSGEENGLQVVGQKSLVNIDGTTALEVIHRQNIKHDSVEGLHDMFGMWATVADLEGDMMKNVTWRIPVDAGFKYLIRLHFSVVGLKMVETAGVVFEVLLSEMIAHTNAEMIRETDGNGDVPGYRDYLLMMKGNKKEGKRDLLIRLQSNGEFIDGHGPLKGFEIFKLSNPDNSLATPNPLFPTPGSYWLFRNLLAVLGCRNVVATLVIATLVFGNIVVHLFQEIQDVSSVEEENVPSTRAKGCCRRFSLAEIQFATRNFSDDLLIGKGGFGKVYKGLIDNGQKTVAMKRLKSKSQQGAHEFLTEIETLSELRHVNLLSLIGYCNQHREMILVYEYMACGTLADHLYKLSRDSNYLPSLTWKQRLNICIGASRGLDYLHTGHSLIHRDVKTSNILLDENFTAKVSDFGLARYEDPSKLQSHEFTKVKGTRGYLDPYYFNTCKLTRKSDTYAFGVVLLETLCERAAVDLSLPEDKQILTKWAQKNIGEGKINEIVASSLRGEISETCLKAFVAVAERCLHDEPKKRPTMVQVVLQLESVLELPDNAGSLVPDGITNDADNISQLKLEINLPANPSSHVLTAASCLQEQTNIDTVNAEPQERKPRIYKPPKKWPWEGLWNRFKPSKQNGSPRSDIAAISWRTIVAATNSFSSSAQCGASNIYKGMLPNGQIVAVKRISAYGYYDGEKLKEEVLLFRTFGHQNIVRPLGYCIHKEERIVVYEFMEMGSLDTFMIAKHGQFEWAMRFRIIIGIARALLYLHQESGLGIIHGHLTLKNILLDSEMHPKIAGFRLRSWEDIMRTTHVTMPIDYMCPDYALYGRPSSKSDVYSFGIIVLEILTGRRSSCLTADQVANVLDNKWRLNEAWRLWIDGKGLELVDESLQGAFSTEEALRCIQVCLLGTQEEPQNRPDMQSVLKMLKGEGVGEGELVISRFAYARHIATHRWAISDTSGATGATFEYDDTMQR